MLDLYIDTADVAEWDALMPTGLFTGITTNPLFLAHRGLTTPPSTGACWRAGLPTSRPRPDGLWPAGPRELCRFRRRSTVEHGRAAGIATVVKVPLTDAGIRQMPKVKVLGGPMLATAAYDTKQMFIATFQLARRVHRALFRPDAGNGPRRRTGAGPDVARSARLRRPGLAAAPDPAARCADTEQLVRLAAAGQDCFTLAPKVARALLFDANTLEAAAQFEEAARRKAERRCRGSESRGEVTAGRPVPAPPARSPRSPTGRRAGSIRLARARHDVPRPQGRRGLRLAQLRPHRATTDGLGEGRLPHP
ncbi:MAG: hypothetical protein R3D59_10845 [Paracoccaceae bacterium]